MNWLQSALRDKASCVSEDIIAKRNTSFQVKTTLRECRTEACGIIIPEMNHNFENINLSRRPVVGKIEFINTKVE